MSVLVKERRKVVKVQREAPHPHAFELDEAVQFDGTRHQVYCRLEPQSKHVTQLDEETGKPIWKLGVNGNRIRKATMRVPITDLADRELTRRQPRGRWGYGKPDPSGRHLPVEGPGEGVVVCDVMDHILVDSGIGLVRENYDFRPDPRQIEKQARREKRERAMEKLGDLLESGRLDVDALSSALDDEAEAPETPDYPRMYGPGLWYLSAADEAAKQGFRGTREAADVELAKRGGG